MGDTMVRRVEVQETKTGRPSWDEYFITIAQAVATRADCSRRKVGAVIVKNNRIVATGYNGAPAGRAGCLEGLCPRGRHYAVPQNSTEYVNTIETPWYVCKCGHTWPCPDAAEPGSQYETGPGMCIAVHAEANALLYADRDKCEGATMYLTCSPCQWCYKLIEGAGIVRVKTPGLEFIVKNVPSADNRARDQVSVNRVRDTDIAVA